MKRVMILVLLSVGTYAWAQECECGRPLATRHAHYEVYGYGYGYGYEKPLPPTFMCYTKKEFDYACHQQQWALRDAGYWMSHPRQVQRREIPEEVLRSRLPPGAYAMWVSYDWISATVITYSHNGWTIQVGKK